MSLRKNPNQRFEELKQTAAQARTPFDMEGWLNLAFYLDEQYVEWNREAKAIRRIARNPKQPNTPRPTFNKIMHFVQQERALVLQAKPTVDIRPATDDFLDTVDAQVAKAYCDWVAEPTQANFFKQLSRATLWAIVCYEGYLKWVWNPRDGRPEIIPCSPFEIYSDPYAKDFQKSRYVIHSQFMDREQVYEQYGVELAKGRSESVDPMKAELLQGMGSAPVVNGVTVNEIWYKPCRRYPQGLYSAWTGTDVLVPPGPFPYDHKRLPFTQIGCIERPDSKHFMSPVKYLRSPQMYFNRYHAQKIMARERFVNYKWWIPQELQLEKDPDDSPAQVLRGHSGNGLKPEILAPPAMPDNGDGAVIEEQMMHIVGLHEVSQAQVPGRVEAAKAIEILKESDADRQQTTLDTITTAISEGFYQVLQLARQYAKAEEMVTIYSRDGMAEVKRFKAAKVVKPGMSVNVTMGTGLARSSAARQDQLYRMWELGIVQDPAQMADLLEISHPTFEAPTAKDKRLARNENLELAQSIAVQPNSWDDHDVHLQEHNDYRKSAEFRAATQDVRERFEFHCQMHEQLRIEELTRRAQEAVMAGGVPPGGVPGASGGDGETATDPTEDGKVNA